MRIVKFQGGLGNQMFQYAFYSALPGKVYADLSWFSRQNRREYLLEKAFGIKVKQPLPFFELLFKHFNRIKERDWQGQNNCYLEGYWQNERCFKGVDVPYLTH